MLAARFDARTAALVAAVTNPQYEPAKDEHRQYRRHVAASPEASPWTRVIKASDFTDNAIGVITSPGQSCPGWEEASRMITRHSSASASRTTPPVGASRTAGPPRITSCASMRAGRVEDGFPAAQERSGSSLTEIIVCNMVFCMQSSAAERAYQYIRDHIIDGSYAMGSKLVEGDIAEAAGVSRTPVREALRRLSSDGLVIFEPGRGGSVASLSKVEILEIYSLRAVLESEVAARACRSMDNPTLDKLEDLACEMESVSNKDQPGHLSTECVRRVATLNSDFHGLLIQHAESPWHARGLTPLAQLSLAYRTMSMYSPDELKRSQGHHRELIAAFIARDPEWAKSTMRSHILAARATLLRAFGKRDELGAISQ